MQKLIVTTALTLAGIACTWVIGKDGREYIKKGTKGGREGKTLWYNGWFK